MTAAAPPRILHQSMSGVDKPGQKYSLIRTYAVGDRRVCVTVVVDAYPNQAQYLAQVWGGATCGWRDVVCILSEDTEVMQNVASGHLPANRSDEKRGSLEWLADELLRRCLEVIA